MPFIYESPDNGITIYRREFGCLKRELIKSKEENTNKKKRVNNVAFKKDNKNLKFEVANRTSSMFSWWYSQ